MLFESRAFAQVAAEMLTPAPARQAAAAPNLAEVIRRLDTAVAAQAVPNRTRGRRRSA